MNFLPVSRDCTDTNTDSTLVAHHALLQLENIASPAPHEPRLNGARRGVRTEEQGTGRSGS